MLHSKVDLNLFLVLKTVYQEGSITAAAHKLHLTQPAVSHSLARLRSRFGDALFVRHGRRMVPTIHCQKIMPQVLSALALLESTLIPDVKFDIHQHQREIRLGFRDIMEWMFLPDLMADLRANTPNITINSWQISLPKMESALQQQEVDIVIDALVPVTSDVMHTLVRHEHFSLICRPEHPILDDLCLEHYISAQHAIASLKDSTVNVVDMALAKHGVTRDVVLRCEHYFAAASVVSRSDLLLTLPNAYAKRLQSKMSVSIAPLPFEMPALPVHMYWHKLSDEDPVITWMREKLLSLGDNLRNSA